VAQAVAVGAESVTDTDVALVCLGEHELPWDALDAADAILLGSPTYAGSPSAALDAFMEESLRPRRTEQRWRDKPAAGFTNSAGTSGDSLATIQRLSDFAAQHGMIWVSLGEPPGWQEATAGPDDLDRLARRFGERIAQLTHRWTRGRLATESVAIVLDAFAAVERGDEARQLELYHPQVEFHWPPSLSYGGNRRADRAHGRPSWEETWRPLQPTTAERQLSPRVVAASEDEVVVLWHQRGRSPDGERYDEEVLGLYGIRDGKFARAQMFYFDSASAARFLDRFTPSA
jgi:ketosteroid isomerase-like protein